jgi:putative endopeptidase
LRKHKENGNNTLFTFGTAFIITLTIVAFGPFETSIVNATILGYGKDFDLLSMNRSVKLEGDFHEYSEGAWIKSTTVPADKSQNKEFEISDDGAYDRMERKIEGVSTRLKLNQLR